MIGADRVELRTGDDDSAAGQLRAAFGLDADRTPAGLSVRVGDGAAFVPRMCARLDVAIESVTVVRPSLDDVFFHYTGRDIREESAPDPGLGEPAAPGSAPTAPACTAEGPPPGGHAVTTAPAVPALPGTGRLADELRAVQVVWHRDMLHYVRDRVKIGVTLLQPLMLLLVLGVGLSSLLPSSNGADYRTFLFPGMLIMMVQSPAISAGVSLVTDRQFGFLREMVVAPVRRETLLIGKCLAGATMATCQGVLLLPLAGVAGVPYDPVMMAALLGEMAVIALMLTALGTMLAVLIRRVETFHALLGVLATPLLFLSGAMFPRPGCPAG
ncbi:ABC transporter permease [Actinomadura yumaensis]|uniref:ABC transporter permease n=1 Tax=Actinomadura yumaensis TaxID=111807 RepID=UPI003617B4B8